MEQNACRDEPSWLDVCADELFWSDEDKPKIVDHRKRGIVWSQWTHTDTKMACGRYGMEHILNLWKVLNWRKDEKDPAWWRRDFVNKYETRTYKPTIQGSSIQTQLKFAVLRGEIDWYYLLKTPEQIEDAINKWHFIFTWSKNINWTKTKNSTDKIMVVDSWPWHIICFIWYDSDKKIFIVRNSSWPNVYDWWHMYLRYEDVWAMFSIYACIPKYDTFEVLKKKIREKINEKKKTMVYKVGIVDWKKVLKWRPK